MAEQFASPQAEEKARELGVNLEDVQGTGQEGAATVDDVKRAGGGQRGARMVSLDPSFGSGEYVVGGQRFVSGVPNPVDPEDYGALPKDDSGKVAAPLTEEKGE